MAGCSFEMRFDDQNDWLHWFRARSRFIKLRAGAISGALHPVPKPASFSAVPSEAE
jgi:hypothetical protein